MEMLTNRIDIAGKITGGITLSHTVFEERFFSSFMEIKRLSGSTDIIPITIPEKIIINSGLSDGAFVRMDGQLRSYNYYLKVNNLDENRRSKLVVTAFCKSVFPFDGYINDVQLDGFVCKNPVYRSTPFGKQITDILVAVNRNYGKSDYIPIIFWGTNALKAADLQIGSHISISGRIQSREYEKRMSSGESLQKTTYEVSGFKFEQKFA